MRAGSDYLERARQLDADDSVTTAIAMAGSRGLGEAVGYEFPIESARKGAFWSEMLDACRYYTPFGKLLSGICDLVQNLDAENRFVKLYRAVAVGQLDDFPRASVAFEDALVGDPIELLAIGQSAVETVLSAAVRNGRVRDIIEVLDKKEWKDAWRPIYEALRAVESGSAEYLKRVAVEIRTPALDILRRIAPNLRERTP